MRPLFTLKRPPTESAAPVQGVSPLGRLISLDVIVVTYVLATVIVVLVGAEQIPNATLVLLCHVGGLVAYGLLRSGSTDGAFLRFLFFLSLFALVVGLFEGMGTILPHLRADVVSQLKADADLARIDRELFGTDPTTWFAPILTPVGVFILQFCYASYFVLAIVVTVVLLARRRYRSFLSYAAIVVGCFFMTYVGYYLVPAYGPRVYYTYVTPIPHGDLSRAIYDTIDALDYIELNAFPSGHTAVTLVYLAILFQESRRIAWLALPLVVGLIVATLALRYHYLIDVIAGVVVAAIWIPWGMRAVFAFDYRNGRGKP